MTDEELVKRLRDKHCCESPNCNCDEAADRIEALTEQLEAARADAKEAEAYAEELGKERDHWKGVAGRQGVCMTCSGPRGAPEPYGCSDCLNTGYCGEWHNEMHELREELAKAVEAAVDAGASLAAAISLLERGGRKAAPSNKMFDQMLVDYRNSLERTRATLAEIEGEKT